MDPNKYAKNDKIKPDSPFSTIKSVISLLLVIIGIIGVAMEFFKEAGIFKTILGKLFESTTSMLWIPVIGVAFWLFNKWTSSPSKTEKRKAGDIPMYIMMAIGAFYLFRIMTTGGF
ncbi:MAG: hypothetical protein SFU55_05625 [Methylophilus sp.]|nr:hypothetical protein [Methylophilus sp.]